MDILFIPNTKKMDRISIICICILITFSKAENSSLTNDKVLQNLNYWKFVNYVNKFNKKYIGNKDTFMDKFKKYSENLKMIQEHNKLFQKNKVSYYLGEGPFTDMNISEYKNLVIKKMDDKFPKCETYVNDKSEYDKFIFTHI